jgi:DNA-binding transcriptional MerR regulator
MLGCPFCSIAVAFSPWLRLLREQPRRNQWPTPCSMFFFPAAWNCHWPSGTGRPAGEFQLAASREGHLRGQVHRGQLVRVTEVGPSPSSASAASVRDDRVTVDQLARKVGMSARNIRAYQARRLLAPPIHIGRNAYYGEGHVHRIEEIQVLQRQGYNLAAIANILGVRERQAGSDQLTAQVEQSLATHPLLIHTFSRYGVVSRGNDGRIRMVRPHALRAALDLVEVGIQPSPSLHLLSETLDRLMPVADDLIRVVGHRALVGMPDRGKADDLGTITALAERLVVLLTEAFRVAVENQGHFWDPELAGAPAERILQSRDGRSADFG